MKSKQDNWKPRVAKMSSSNPGWWRWVVMCSCTLCLFLGGSQTFSCGVFHVALLAHYEQDPVLTAWLGSLFASMFALSGPISSFVVNVTSYRSCTMLGSLLILVGFTLSAFVTDMRWLFLTYAVLAGLGEGMVYLGSIVAISVYFPGQVSMANGVGLAGLSLGVFVFPPLAQFLLDEFGLQGCFLLTGAAGFQSAVFAALLRPCTVRIKDTQTSEESMCKRMLNSVSGEKGSIRDLLKPSFLLFLVSAYFFAGAVYVNYLYLPDFWIKHGSTSRQASFLFAVAGAGGVVSRILAGFAANDSNIGPLVLYTGSYGLAAIVQFFIESICATLGGKIGYSLLFGIYCSTGWVLMSPITMLIVGRKNFTTALGVAMLFLGLGALTVPPITGLIGEHTGGYSTIFNLAGACFSCTCLLALLLMFLSRPQEPSKHEADIRRSEVVAGLEVPIGD